MPDMDGVAATRAILSQRPSVGVIMMSVMNEPDILRRSMVAGAREFLVKPFSLDELLTSIRTVHANTPKMMMAATAGPESNLAHPSPVRRDGKGTVIALAGVKGGIGRSTIATNLAVALQQTGLRRVALVDANTSFGDVAVMMNVTDSKTMLDAVPYLRQIDAELLNNIMAEHSSGVRLLLAPPSPQEAEVVTSDLVKQAIAVLSDLYDVVIVDTRPGFDDLNLGIFDSSDIIMLVVTMDMTSIKDARQFLEVTDLLGYPSERVRLVLNRVNSYSGIPAEEIGDSLRRTLWAQIPDDPGPVLRSINEGVPIVDSSPDAKAALELKRISKELLVELAPETVSAGQDGKASKPKLVSRFRVTLRSAS